jgi:acyl-CoA:acyl-CoA alkyltransferase
MKFNRVYLEAIGYELAPVIVSTAELEARLEPIYRTLHMPMGQLEALTGITERRWWKANTPVSQGAIKAAKKALAMTDLPPDHIDIVIYAGVCREQFEPATACRVAAELGVSDDATVYDLSNACLGVLNGIIEVANRIELGQCRAGLVVSCETAREINEVMIDKMVRNPSMDVYREALATLTGGSGAVAVLVVDEEYSTGKRRKLLGGVTKTAPQHHALCRWGFETFLPTAVEKILNTEAGSLLRYGYQLGMKHCVTPFMATDAGSVLKFGVDLGMRTWRNFLQKLAFSGDMLDRVICHQVGAGHREAIMNGLGIPLDRDYSTFSYLGNMGTVSLPLTAAVAEENKFLKEGDQVGFLGIGSGLNCLMLGLKW